MGSAPDSPMGKSRHIKNEATCLWGVEEPETRPRSPHTPIALVLIIGSYEAMPRVVSSLCLLNMEKSRALDTSLVSTHSEPSLHPLSPKLAHVLP